MHVLLSAYACAPDGVSEAAYGWGWATELAARGLHIHVLTADRHRESILAELKARPRENLEFSFVEPRFPGVPSSIGGRHYLAWQFAAISKAREINATCKIHVIHHVTYGSIHVPSQLWRLGIPTIFGPVGGGQTTAKPMLCYFGASKNSEIFRTMLTYALRFSPLHRRWLSKMSCIFAANKETKALVTRLGRPDAVLSMDPGLPSEFYAEKSRSFPESDTLQLFWAARLLPRKALGLALDALQKTKSEVKLTIAGGGLPDQVVRKMINDRDLATKVHWLGKISWSEMRSSYLSHDAFLFTSVRDSCGVQLLEAMALGLPVITLDHQGGTLLVPASAGIKVPVTTPQETSQAIADAIDNFSGLSINERDEMSACALEKAKTLAWPLRAERAHRLYDALCAAPAGQTRLQTIDPL